MALSKEQKDHIKEELKNLFGGIRLLCDGYTVYASLHRISETKLGIDVYFKGKWMLWKNQHEESKRFYPTHKRRLISEKANKILKRPPEDVFLYFKRSYFSTANAFINHISKHNENIRIISSEEYQQLNAEKEKANEE